MQQKGYFFTKSLSMGFIRHLRLRFHRYFLNRERQQVQRTPRSVNWEDAGYIGILFDATDLNKRQTVLQYSQRLKAQGRKVKLLGYFHVDQNDPNFTFRYFNRKQLDWALRPATPEVKAFIEEPFDLLLNIDPATRVHSEYIALLSRAALKVGPYTKNTDCYDLMIDPADSGNVKAFIQQVESLLKKTQIRHAAAQV